MNHESMIRAAYKVALRSPDPSTQNGAVLIPETLQPIYGWNHPPKGVRLDSERLERPLKYEILEHAERHVIYECAKFGVATSRATLCCVWAPCCDCARAIAMSGVSRLVVHAPRMLVRHNRWADKIDLANQILVESGVELVEVSGPILGAKMIRVDGRSWSPETCDFIG